MPGGVYPPHPPYAHIWSSCMHGKGFSILQKPLESNYKLLLPHAEQRTLKRIQSIQIRLLAKKLYVQTNVDLTILDLTIIFDLTIILMLTKILINKNTRFSDNSRVQKFDSTIFLQLARRCFNFQG